MAGSEPQLVDSAGPAIWICGDCHLGNLGPIADTEGHVQVQIRDLDQTVIGNPAHDLIRLGLSLATAARGSDLPGITTVRMIETLMEGYESAFPENDEPHPEKPKAVKLVMKKAMKRTWKQLARERIVDTDPVIPLGKRFWPLAREERKAIDSLFSAPALAELVTQLNSRADTRVSRWSTRLTGARAAARWAGCAMRCCWMSMAATSMARICV
jgi:uncharacterized protein (DUF2252 family)